MAKVIHKLYHNNYLGIWIFSAARGGQDLHQFIFSSFFIDKFKIIFTFISDQIGHRARTTNAKCKIRIYRFLFKSDIHVLKTSLHFLT